MARSIEEAEARIEQLEGLVSVLRHDIRGAITPALLIADGLRLHAEPRIARAGEKIADSVDRVAKLLSGTRDLVPSRHGAGERAR